jgi:phage shock protein C
VNPRRLYRSRYDRQLAGVAAGMAEYLDLDPTLVRILWILSALFGGFTILLYVILAFVMPLAPVAAMPAGPGAPGGPVAADGGATPDAEGAPAGPEGTGWTGAGWMPPAAARPGAEPGRGAGFYAGILLVAFGAIALANSTIPGWAGAIHLGPVLLVALGAALLVRSMHRTADES